MSRKIEIELTSARPDGTWTWRVAGAKQPKGVLESALLPPEAKVGDVLRAEAEIELEGTVITSVLAPPPKRAEPERLQIIGDSRPFEGVTTSLVPKGSRPRRDRDDRPGRPDRGDRPAARGDRPPVRHDRPDAGQRAPEPAEGRGSPRPDRQGPPRDRPGTDRRSGSARTSGPGRDRAAPPRHERTDTNAERAPSGPPRARRLNPGTVHRSAVLDSLAPEERPVAEQLLQGGLPAVRRAVQEQNAKALTEGRPQVQPDALLALAEELLPRLKAAEWRDRAEAASKDVDALNLRDLRSIIAGADAGARDDESRILAKSLREALDHAPPGVIDPRSWAYWNSKLGRYPAPPPPTRRLG